MMKLSALCLLLCSVSITYARNIARGAVDSSPGNVSCEYSQVNGSVNPDCLTSQLDSDLLFNGTTVITHKTVIPDLTALDYTWYDVDDEGTYFLEWNTVTVDVFSVSTSVTNMLYVTLAFNKETDTNPKKVPLRDIILSFWKYKKGRRVQDLEYIVYENVIEKDMRALLPEVYDILGRSMEDDMNNSALVTLRPSVGGNEERAYNLLLNGCPFPAGAKKMLAEYAEFSNRQLGNFEIKWSGGSSFNFFVYFYSQIP